MASGQTLLIIPAAQANAPPATIYATFDTVTGTSTPVEGIPVLDFDATTSEYADFLVVMPLHYAGTTGITATIIALYPTTTGTCIWNMAIRRIADDAEDLDTTAHTYDYNAVTVSTLPSVAGETSHDDITFTNGADMDSWAVGEPAIIRVRRDIADTMAGDASLLAIHIKET